MDTIRNRIKEVLKESLFPLAEHEFPFCGTNSSCLTRELRRMQAEGLVKSQRRLDAVTGKLKKFKEWELTNKGE